jgi:hypothetical protein
VVLADRRLCGEFQFAGAGHSVEVLLRIYAKCLDGGDALVRRRVQTALGHADTDTATDAGHGTGTHARPQPDLTGRRRTHNTACNLHSYRSQAVLYWSSVVAQLTPMRTASRWSKDRRSGWPGSMRQHGSLRLNRRRHLRESRIQERPPRSAVTPKTAKVDK